jgi:hypothetical protein
MEFNLLFESRYQLIEEVTDIDDKTFNHRPSPDTWSIAQICHHLYLTECLFTEAIANGLKDKSYKNIIQKNIYLVSDMTKKFKSPEMAIPSKEHFAMKEISNLLFESRNRLLDIIFDMDNRSVLYRKKARHPMFGDLSLVQWIDLLSLHEQRHIVQIQGVKL